MSKPPITTTLDHTIEETAEVLLERNISGLLWWIREAT